MTEHRFTGINVTPLVGIGTVVRYDRDASLEFNQIQSETVDTKSEIQRFESARDIASEKLELEQSRIAKRVGEKEAAIFEAHQQFLKDTQITDGVHVAISEDGLSAEQAVSRAFEDPISQFESAEGMFAERADDLRDVRDRLLHILLDHDRVDLSALPNETVLVAERLTPSDTAQLNPNVVTGFVTAEGGRTSHAAIMARSLAIPAVVGVGPEILDIEENTRIMVDGNEGEVLIEPDDDAVKSQSQRAEIRHDPISTSDEQQIEIAANVGTPQEARAAVKRGADGIGLFRTEFLFLDRENPPDEDEQYNALRDVCQYFDEKRVVVRTLDIGGDKPIPYIDSDPGNNPFLGVRGVRLVPGERSDLFESHIRAILRAAALDAELAMMFPLVSTVTELTDILDRVDLIATELDEEGIPYAIPELGVMIETPASTFLAREFAERLDFLSIGTNDLTQYVMASSRNDDRVATLHDPLHPAVLRAIAHTVEAGHEGDVWVGMCGEMAGDPKLTKLLVGLDLDELSMSAVTVPDVKANLNDIDSKKASSMAETALRAETRADVRELFD